MDPEDFVEDPARLEGGPMGWLLEYPREQWDEELESATSRGLEHVTAMYDAKDMAPGILINGLFGDGRGRANFYWGIGEKMPVAVFRSKTVAHNVADVSDPSELAELHQYLQDCGVAADDFPGATQARP